MGERTNNEVKTADPRTRRPTLVSLGLAGALCWCAIPAHSDPLPYDYPTSARVEYVQDCIGSHGGKLEDLYKCSCVIDRLAQQLHDNVKGFVGVVNDDVLLADGGKAVAVEFADALGVCANRCRARARHDQVLLRR